MLTIESGSLQKGLATSTLFDLADVLCRCWILGKHRQLVRVFIDGALTLSKTGYQYDKFISLQLEVVVFLC